MLSYAGKSYSKTRVVSPYKTRQRFRYYQLEPIHSPRKLPKSYQTLDSNLRQKNDSFLLRYSKEIVTTTNHSPNYETVHTNSPRQVFNKAAFQRYIGEIKDEDYSLPLKENCNHRCAKANNAETQHIPSTPSSINSDYSKLKDSSLETASVEKNEYRSQELVNFHLLDLSKKLQRSALKSTEPTLIKRRAKLTLDEDEKPFKPRRLKGLSFDSSAGHKYLKEIQDQEPLPEFYNIQHSKQSFIRNSFQEPKGNVKFGTYRNTIATRYDRADPNWHLSMDSSNFEMETKDKLGNFQHYSSRLPNEVKSKYPMRGSMNLYSFPVREQIIEFQQ